ncbi:MAG: hypothetical protein FJY10_08625 [Bacteroidetes bacterium]|nr:hypothetical protein [Bacteroidota bacterium]
MEPTLFGLSYSRLLSIFLWLVAIHSILVGLGLMFLPISVLEWFGFVIEEKFFTVQGGVFHIVVSVAYIMAALNIPNSPRLIMFSFTAKFIATVFLFTYFFLVNPIITVLLSGVGDFLMGVVIFILYCILRKQRVLNL